MQCIDEVCDLLSRKAESRYAEAQENYSCLPDNFENEAKLTTEQVNALEAAKKNICEPQKAIWR